MAKHSALSIFMFHRDPNRPSSFKLAPSPSSAGFKGRNLLSGAGSSPRDGLGLVSVSLDRLIGAIPVCAQVAGGAVFFRCTCSEPDTSFSVSLGGRKNEEGDERRVEEAEDEELPLSQCHYVNLIQG